MHINFCIKRPILFKEMLQDVFYFAQKCTGNRFELKMHVHSNNFILECCLAYLPFRSKCLSDLPVNWYGLHFLVPNLLCS